jgi:hypothetical protein
MLSIALSGRYAIKWKYYGMGIDSQISVPENNVVFIIFYVIGHFITISCH